MTSNNKYTDKLYNLLKESRVKRDQKYTHYSMGNPVGCYYLTGSKRDRLNKLVSKSLQEGAKLHILEKHRSQGPILFDIDIKYESDSNVRKYNYNHILKTVEIYNKVIKSYINVESNYGHCFITEKNEPTLVSENIYKDGFHGQYPNICASNELQYLIRKKVIEEFKKEDFFGDINCINDYEDIFDKAVIESNGWFLYGCSKPSRDPYLLKYIIGDDLNKYNKKKFTLNNLPQILSIRNYGKDDITCINDNLDHDEMENEIKQLNIKKKKTDSVKKQREYSEDEIIYCQELTKLLSADRADNYHTWIQVGWALHNIDDLLLDDFISFSQLSNKFKLGECEKLWGKMKHQGEYGLNLGSLVRWAKEDNYEEFIKLRDNQEFKIIKRSISGTSGDVAKTFYEINKNRYVCASIKHSLWYEFKNHRWNVLDSANSIMLELNDIYPDKYDKVADYFFYKSQQLQGDEKKFMELKRESALKVKQKLTTNKFKKEIIDELKYRYYDEDFLNKLNENRYLLGCKNGVYDFKNEVFRDGQPNDYISFTTNIEYKSLDSEDDNVKQVINFFNEIQPETEMCDYILDFFSSCLVGNRTDEEFNIWTGSGANAKSLSINFFQTILGDYATTINITLLTNKRAASNSASPEKAKTKGKRFVVFQEPENDDVVHVGHMKELTGNDKIEARGLFKEPIEFYPQFKIILTCNKLPFIPSNDGGTWRRIRVAPFEMKFVDDPKEPKERKKDKFLKEKMEDWKEAFLFLLVDRYISRIKKGCMKVPDKVKSYTEEYKKKSDIFLEYVNEQLEITDNKKDRINLTNLYYDFKMWHKEAHSESKVCSRLEFKIGIEEKIGKITNRGWRYIKFKVSDEEDNETESNNILIK